MRVTGIGRVSGPGGWRTLCAGAAALAAVGVLGAVPPAVASASSQALDWTKQAPAASPPAREGAVMAYDAATGDVVLFGGATSTGTVADTWTWDGTTWTKQHPAASPSARFPGAMAYDAATGTVVLFGGFNGRYLGDTWTWDGTTWTQQAPLASPHARNNTAMAYDAATGTVVLFGGLYSNAHVVRDFGDTWTWG